jgi:hypothetical protein
MVYESFLKTLEMVLLYIAYIFEMYLYLSCFTARAVLIQNINSSEWPGKLKYYLLN